MEPLLIGALVVGGLIALKNHGSGAGVDSATYIDPTTGRTVRKLVSKSPLGSLNPLALAPFNNGAGTPVPVTYPNPFTPTPDLAPTPAPIQTQSSGPTFPGPIECFINCYPDPGSIVIVALPQPPQPSVTVPDTSSIPPDATVDIYGNVVQQDYQNANGGY
jgi:hypothetical protein